MLNMLETDVSLIDIPTLRDTVNILLNRMIDVLGDDPVAIPTDSEFYWEFEYPDLHQVGDGSRAPTAAIGSLADDWHFIQHIVANPETALSLQMVHVVPLLRWLGYVIRR